MLFKRGVRPEESKLTEGSPIERIEPPHRLTLFLKQHIGKPAIPSVKRGDPVKAFQRIAEADGPISANVHSPVEGTVIAIEPAPHPGGNDELAIIIEKTKDTEPPLKKKPGRQSQAAILESIREAGIVGLGGAMFPTHAKLSVPKEKNVQLLLINASECEPYLTSDSSLMMEYAKEIFQGIRLIMKALDVQKALVGIEKNKKAAILAMKKEQDKDISVIPLRTRYPQGAEKILIKTLTGKEVPAGGLPTDIGIVVLNVATAFAVCEAVTLGKPLVERVITVTGDVKQPKNLIAPLGSTYKSLIDACGGYVGMPKKIICGGPMMGLSQHTDKVATIKGNNGIVVFNDRRKETLCPEEEGACIRCGKCVDACPMRLSPTTIMKFSRKGHYGYAKANHSLDCFECGCCSYVCPQRINIVSWIRLAKKEICK